MRIFVDMDDVLCDYQGAYQRILAEEPSVKWPQSQPGFFLNLEPLPSAIESIQAIREMDGADVHILTAPSTLNPHCYTEKRLWVEKHLGHDFVERLHISPDKSLFIGDILIDDYINGKGQEGFSGRVLHFGSECYPDWPAVLQALKQLLINSQPPGSMGTKAD